MSRCQLVLMVHKVLNSVLAVDNLLDIEERGHDPSFKLPLSERRAAVIDVVVKASFFATTCRFDDI